VAENATLMAGIFVAAIVAMATPPLWTTHRRILCLWPIEPTSMACTMLASRSHGFFRCFRVGIRFRGTCRRIFLFRFGHGAGKAGVRGAGRRRHPLLATCRSCRFVARPTVRRYDYCTAVRISADALRHLADHFVVVYAWCRWGLRRKVSAPHPNSEKHRCWSTGAHELFMEDFRSCQKGSAAR